MFLFGHIGLTVGIAYLYVHRTHTQLDYRIVILGALFMDIIDKSIGYIIFPDINNGRLIAHTLLFVISITAIGMITRKKYIYVLSLGLWTHMVFDRMWESPNVLLWPLLSGFGTKASSFIELLQYSLLNDTLVYIPEIIGGFVLLFILINHELYRINNFMNFIKTGYIKDYSRKYY